MEGIEAARGRYPAPRGWAPGPHLQSGPRHTARDAGGECEEPGAICTGIFPSSFRTADMTRIAIIGGGISGLSAAFYMEEKRRAGADAEYVLYESSPRLGGVLRTEHIEGCLVEAGPDSFVTEK